MTTLKPALTDQPGAAPTRKMIAFAVSSLIAAALLQATQDLAAAHGGQATQDLAAAHGWFAWLASDGAQGALPILAGALAGYLTRDRLN